MQDSADALFNPCGPQSWRRSSVIQCKLSIELKYDDANYGKIKGGDIRMYLNVTYKKINFIIIGDTVRLPLFPRQLLAGTCSYRDTYYLGKCYKPVISYTRYEIITVS